MKRLKLKHLIISVMLMILYGGGATIDLLNLSTNPSWSMFQKLRIMMHLKAVTMTTFFIPPIGPLKPLHHGGRLLDAYIDHNEPPEYTMNFLRSLVVESRDCQKKIASHEKGYLSGKAKNLGIIYCEVPFGYGLQDTFKIQVYSERIKSKIKTAFFVNGLGLVPSGKNQSPVHLLRGMGALKDKIKISVIKLDGLIAQLKRQKMGSGIWINLTDAAETSRFSNYRHRMSIREWIKKTQKRNRMGKGISAERMYTIYR